MTKFAARNGSSKQYYGHVLRKLHYKHSRREKLYYFLHKPRLVYTRDKNQILEKLVRNNFTNELMYKLKLACDEKLSFFSFFFSEKAYGEDSPNKACNNEDIL